MTLARRLALLGLPLLVGCARQPEPVVAAPAPPPIEPAAIVPELHFAVYGDTRSFPDLHRKIVAGIVAARPEFVLQTGDMVGGDGTDPAAWDEFIGIIRPLTDLGDYYPVYGNHDRGLDNLRSRFPKLPPETARVGYYTFVRGNCRFIGLNTNTIRLVGKDEEQIAWLKTTLAANQAEHVFVFLHHPLYSIGGYKPGDLTVRKRLQPIFEQDPAIRAVFAAHDHGYYRTRRGSIWYIVTAGGGAPLYQQDPSLMQAGDVRKGCRHFMEIRVEGPRVIATATDIDGQEFDRFDLAPVAAEPAAAAGG